MRSADIVLYIFDVNTETSTDLQQQVKIFKEASIKYLLVGNKVDGELNEHFSKYDETPDVHFISAKNHSGLPGLKALLFDKTAQGSPESEDSIITNARHYEALPEVQKSLVDIKAGLGNGLPGDLLALDIRRCLFYLGEITGEITNEDKLDYIFSKFCIGK